MPFYLGCNRSFERAPVSNAVFWYCFDTFLIPFQDLVGLRNVVEVMVQGLGVVLVLSGARQSRHFESVGWLASNYLHYGV